MSQFRPVSLSSDGVSECLSNNNCLDVYSFKFKNCRTIYPHTIIRSITKKYKVDYKKTFENIISDLHKNNCTIKNFIADNLKRANARDALNHASTFACEYCFAKATVFNVCDAIINNKKSKLIAHKQFLVERLNSLRESGGDNEEIQTIQEIIDTITKSIKDVSKRGHLVWPSSTMGGEDRTKEKILNIVEKIEENGGEISKEEAKGIRGRSPFLAIPYFNIVKHMPCEYLHSTCLGVCKRLVELTFQVGANRHRNTKRKLSSAASFNLEMAKIKVVHEFSRRVRELDFAVMKGQEFRNIAIFFLYQ